MRKFVATLGLLLLVLPNLFAAEGHQGANLVKLFLEDFGGNSPSDPKLKGSAIPQCTYVHDDKLTKDGRYSIRKIAFEDAEKNRWYYPFYDHTFPGDGSRGYMLQTDGNDKPGTFYHTTLDGVCGGSRLYFNLWACSCAKKDDKAIADNGNAYLSLVVKDQDGEIIGKKDVTLYRQVGLWQEFGMYVNLPANTTSVRYEVVNNSKLNGYNNFFLDDIGISLCLPSVKADAPAAACLGEDVTLSGQYANDGALNDSLYYRWLFSKTGALNGEWESLPVLDKPEYVLNAVSDANAGFYRLAVGAAGNEDKLLCASISDPVEVKVRDCEKSAIFPANDFYFINSCGGPYTFDVLQNDEIGTSDFTVELVGKNSIPKNKAEFVEGKKIEYTVADPVNGIDVLTYVVKSGDVRREASVYITIKKNIETFLVDTICAGEVYDFAGGKLVESEVVSEKMKTAKGCDSLVQLNLHVRTQIITEINDTIDDGETYIFGDSELKDPGNYTKTYKSVHGCDSIVNLHLYVVIHTSITASICEGDSYPFDGKNFKETGNYDSRIFKTTSGKDSIVTLKLTVHDVANEEIDRTICSGNSYLFLGKKLTTSGTYTDTTKSISGCDSVVTLNLFVAEVNKVNVFDSFCSGDDYVIGDSSYAYPGTFSLFLKNRWGCDSTVILELTAKYPVSVQIKDTINQGETYSFGGRELSTTGTYADTLKGANGCDSIVNLKLKVVGTIRVEVDDAVCQGKTYRFGTQRLKEAGVYTETFKSFDGEDSVVTLNLKVLETPVVAFSDFFCKGAVYPFGDQDLNMAGDYQGVFTAANGCDSTVNLTLEERLPVVDSISARICSGESYTFGNQTLTESGSYTEVFKAHNDCDSIVTLNLKVLGDISDTVRAQICEGGSYLFGDRVLTEAGTYTLSLMSSLGCDSVVTLSLEVKSELSSSLSESICEGQTYIFGGEELSLPGTYTKTFLSSLGCDSVVTLQLSVLSRAEMVLNAVICAGESYTFGEQVLTESGTYTQVYKAANGCDSTVTVSLLVLDAVNTPVVAAICAGESYNFGGEVLTETGTYTQVYKAANGCDSIVTLSLKVFEPISAVVFETICEGQTFLFGDEVLTAGGIYSKAFKSVGGCDSVVTLHLTVQAPYNHVFNEIICEGDVYTFNGEERAFQVGIHQLAGSFSSVNGCDSSVVVNLSVLPASRVEIADTAKAGETYSRFGFSLGKLSAEGVETHVLNTVNAAGCDSIVTLYLVVLPGFADRAIPNAFSPANADGTNDVFMPGYTVFIYDRYGNLVCHSTDGWDGRYRGDFADAGVYVYVVTMKDGKMRKGTVELLKN